MDAEFGKPWILDTLDQMGKQVLIDVPSNFRVYKTNPRLSYRPKDPRFARLKYRRKSQSVDSFRFAHGKRRWRRVEIRDSSRGLMITECLHKRVWFWAKDNEHPPRRWHLFIRRTPSKDGGYTYKYALSNSPSNTSTQRLAYQQSQRYWVEQAIKDSKDGLGMAEYQFRKWNAWQHHVALTMLAGLYVLKTRLEKREDLPLLSLTDVKAILAFLLPAKIQSLKDLLRQIDARHQRRYRSYQRAKEREPSAIPWPKSATVPG